MSSNTTDFLDKKATQVAFAELIGITQPGVNRHIGGCLQKGQSLRVWLHSYCEHLRNEAAGRGGNDQANLTRARIEESEAKTRMTNVAYAEKIKSLVPANDALDILTEWASYTVNEIEQCHAAVVHEIETKFSITIDDALVSEFVVPSNERIGKYASKLGESLAQDGSIEQPEKE